MAIPIEFSEFRDRSPSDRLVILGAGASRDLGVPSGEEVIELIQQRKSEMKVLASLCRRAEFEPAVAALDFLIEQGDPFTASAVLSQFLKAYSGPLLISDIAALKNEKRALLQLLRENMYKPRDTSPTDEEREFVDGILDLQRGSTIISLNYDNLLEWAGSDRIVPVVRDGTDRVTVPPTEPDLTRVLHLHGAITWSEYKNIVVDHHRPPHDEAAALVLGVGNKLRYYEPFLEMYQVLRDELRRVSAILTVGFSFRDAHVVQQLTEWAERVGEQGQLHICNPVGELPDQIKDWKYIQGVHIKSWRMSAMAFVLKKVCGNEPDLVIVAAYYGAGGPGATDLDVTDLVVGQLREGRLDFEVDDEALGVTQANDPAWQQLKQLRVRFQVAGAESEHIVRQHDRLQLP